MDTFLDVSGIVKRAKQALNFKKDSELASYLGVSRATLSNWCVTAVGAIGEEQK